MPIVWVVGHSLSKLESRGLGLDRLGGKNGQKEIVARIRSLLWGEGESKEAERELEASSSFKVIHLAVLSFRLLIEKERRCPTFEAQYRYFGKVALRILGGNAGDGEISVDFICVEA